MPEPAMPLRPMSGLPDEPLDDPAGADSVPVPVPLGDGLVCDGLGAEELPAEDPVLVSFGIDPVLPGVVLVPLGLAPLGLPLGPAPGLDDPDDPIPPDVACATITPPSGGA